MFGEFQVLVTFDVSQLEAIFFEESVDALVELVVFFFKLDFSGKGLGQFVFTLIEFFEGGG